MEPNFGALPNLSVKATPTIKEMAEERKGVLQLLKDHLVRAQARIKAYADKHRTEREFQVDDDALLKLQPYAQASLVNRPCAKLAFRFFGPFKILERIGRVSVQVGASCQLRRAPRLPRLAIEAIHTELHAGLRQASATTGH
jgi:hypothetical protein